MRHFLILLSLVLCTACAGIPAKPAFSDFIEIRSLADDDPLAHTFASVGGERYKLGDVVITGRAVRRFQVIRSDEEQYDLLLTLDGAEVLRWRRYARTRPGENMALVVDGKVQATFSIVTPGEEEIPIILTIPNVCSNEKDALKLEQYIDSAKQLKKKD